MRRENASQTANSSDALIRKEAKVTNNGPGHNLGRSSCQDNYFFDASISAGTICEMSPTMP